MSTLTCVALLAAQAISGLGDLPSTRQRTRHVDAFTVTTATDERCNRRTRLDLTCGVPLCNLPALPDRSIFDGSNGASALKLDASSVLNGSALCPCVLCRSNGSGRSAAITATGQAPQTTARC